MPWNDAPTAWAVSSISVRSSSGWAANSIRSPSEARSTLYCTDVAKMIQVPIFHVNGDDPEAVVHCMRLAMAYRQRFGEDVVIDLVCYRRHGHNEGDEPSFTQPLLYERIRKRESVRVLYTRHLIGVRCLAYVTLTAMEKVVADTCLRVHWC